MMCLQRAEPANWPVRTIVMADESIPLENALNEALEAAESGKVTVGALLDRFDDRSFGPLFMLLGLLCIIPPVSAIPGLPSVVGVLLILFCVQLLFRRDHVWMPQIIEQLSVSDEALRKAMNKSSNVLAFIDREVSQRWEWAVSGPGRMAAAVIVCFMALLMIPLEIVPFAVSAPGAAIAMMGLALTARDGVLMVTGFAISAAALILSGWFLIPKLLG